MDMMTKNTIFGFIYQNLHIILVLGNKYYCMECLGIKELLCTGTNIYLSPATQDSEKPNFDESLPKLY